MAAKSVVINKGNNWIGLLGVIFVLCKIFEIGVIATWSWWLVLLPFYIMIAVLLGILFGGAAIAGFLFLVARAIDEVTRRKRRKEYLARIAKQEAELNK
jgi:hypothetical protein